MIVRGVSPKSMILPHCTWDKFGEILADGGERSLGLFDELMSFFTTMNMYSSNKMQVSDTRKYQDFLQLFTGKSNIAFQFYNPPSPFQWILEVLPLKSTINLLFT